VISYGEEKPLDPRHNEEAWAKNRRAETTIED
jgi:peptidoglycan-associated lipoprotein